MQRRFISLLILPLAGVMLSGCQSADASSLQACQSPGSSLVLVVAATENSFSAIPNEVTCLAKRAVVERKPITVIREDGAPAAVQTARVYPVNDGAKDNDVNKALNALIPVVTGVKAQADGDNVMAAVDIVSRTSSGDATVVFIGPGLADKGALDLTKPALITADPAAVTAKLQNMNSIPDLSGRTIYWYGLGEARGTQQPLTPAQRNNYQGIYASIFAAAGAHAEFRPGPTGTSKSNPGNGHTIVPVPPAQQESVDFPATGNVTFRDGSALGFEPESTTLRDPSAAEEEIGKMARWLKVHPHGVITVTGTTSSAGDEAGRLKKSSERAQVICSLAVQAGADPTRLRSKGVGSSFDGYVYDRLPNGDLDESVAPSNRNVIISFTS